jgi:Ser/Thr protein kinase RdoA (MazF antagonist)
VDTVLSASRPALSDADAIELARACFGVTATTARDLGSERDRTFGLDAADGEPVAILKVSNASEDPEVLDMEAEAALHVMGVDPGLRVAVPWRAAGNVATALRGPARPGSAAADLRARWSHGDVTHWARLYDVLPGHSRIEAV